MALPPLSSGLIIPDEATFDPFEAEGLAERGDTSMSAFLSAFPNPAQAQPKQAPSFVGINDATGRVRVNAFEFDVNDSRSALQSREHLRDPISPLPAGFRPIAPDEYKTYLQQIEDPSFGRLAAENFAIGVQNLKLLGGRGLQFLGAEETGQEIVDEAAEQIGFDEPFQRMFTDIESAEGAIDWFVSNLAQQGPNLIESALVAIAGAVAGGIVGNVPGAIFGAIGGLSLKAAGKEGIKQAVMAAAKKRIAGETLSDAERKLLKEMASGAAAAEIRKSPGSIGAAKAIEQTAGEILKRGKTQARIGGAVGASALGNLAFGVSDITGEQAEAGERNRAVALALGIPYALFETLPEFIGLGFLAKGVRGGRFVRGAKGLGAGAVGEGITEASQEALLLGQNREVDIASSEGLHRLVNSFAAGAGVGGTLGGLGAAIRRAPIDPEEEGADLLQLPGPETPFQLTDQRGPPPVPGTLLEGPDPIDLLGGPGAAALLETTAGGASAGNNFVRLQQLVEEQENIIQQIETLDPDSNARLILEDLLEDLRGEINREIVVIQSQQWYPTEIRTAVGDQPIFAGGARFPEGAIPPEPTPLPTPPPSAPDTALSAAFGAAQQAVAQPPIQEAPVVPQGARPQAVPPAFVTPGFAANALAVQQEEQAAQTAQIAAAAQLAQAEQEQFAPAEAQNIAIPPGQQELFPQADFGDQPIPAGFPTALPKGRFINGEEAIASPVDGVLTPVRKLIEDAQQLFVALKKLEKCLGT